MMKELHENKTAGAVLLNSLMATASLFVYGFGVYLTIQANLGVSPWDVLNLGISKSFGVLFGTASIAVSLFILIIDVFLHEPVGISMFIDAIVVGKAVDFFNWLQVVPPCHSLITGILMILIGLFILGYSQYTYMLASLGCGPRDALLVALTKRVKIIPIGAVSIAILSIATLIGWMLGGPVGIGTILCAFATGPIMQLAFRTVHFDATSVRHQSIQDSLRVIGASLKAGRKK